MTGAVKTSKKSFSSRRSSFLLGGDSEQLVGGIHHDAVVAGGVLGEGSFELGGHESGVSGRVQDVVEAGAKLIASREFEVDSATNAGRER